VLLSLIPGALSLYAALKTLDRHAMLIAVGYELFKPGI
jgi:hypothetical protein